MKHRLTTWEQRVADEDYRASFKLRWDIAKLKLFRELTGLTTGEFCALAGLSQPTLKRNEKAGKISFSTENMIKIDQAVEKWKEHKIAELQNQIQLLKFPLAETSISTFQLHAFCHLDP